MRKAIRLIASLAVLSLAISMFSACNSPLSSNSPTTDGYTDTSSVTTTADNATLITEITDESKPTGTTTVTKVETDSVETILNLIANYPMGTAGSAQKCIDISIRLINFTENNETKADKLSREISSYLTSLDSKHATLFEQNLYEIDYTARKLIKGETSSYQANIDQSSEKFSKGKYTLSKYEEIYKLIANN